MIKAKRIDNGEWVRGYLFRFKDWYYISDVEQTCIQTYCKEGGVANFNLRAFEVDPETVCRYLEMEYMDGEEAWEGDIFESQSNGLKMVLRYGNHLAWCPEDQCETEGMGFFAEAQGYMQMPIGDLSCYALKCGNIFDKDDKEERVG